MYENLQSRIKKRIEIDASELLRGRPRKPKEMAKTLADRALKVMIDCCNEHAFIVAKENKKRAKKLLIS